MRSLDEAELRHWLVDRLITTVGCDPDEIRPDSSFSDLGLGSRDAVSLSGELAEFLERPVSPVEFWQHPTINGLVEYLTNPESQQSGTPDSAHQSWAEEPIAVIGMGCRFPGGIHDPEEFWQFMWDGRSAVGTVPPDRWARFEDASPEAAAALSDTTRWGSFLADIDAFDAEFFEISPREAAKMDPQQRLLLEVTYEALENAGIPADALRRTQTGVFAGACAGEYGYLASSDLSQVDAWSGTGGSLSIIANRVSYFFDLRGPSVTVDTACSSGLVAIHLACQSLRSGDSNLAIAAGVNLLLSPVITRSFDHAEAMSPTGQCHAFDAGADGFVRGEGCGVVVLKRLSDALRDDDPVSAVVRGSAVNQDGRSNGLMAPNPAAQMAVLRAACSNAGVPPHEVDYVEAHATGTLLGDPIEARALGTVLGRTRPQSAPLLIGSVKPSLGHLDAAAGIAGFVKAALALKRGQIPPNLNFRNPNPHIPFGDMGLKVVAEHTNWPATGRPRRAGVSSFGFGGTNAHVVLEQEPDRAFVTPENRESGGTVTTLVVSGKTPERVASAAAVLAQWMDGAGAGVPLAEVAHTLNHHRARHTKFATVAALDRAQAVSGLHALAAGRSADGVVAHHEGGCRPGTVFVYSGHGSGWAGMGRRLLADEPGFAAAVAELEPVFVSQLGFSLQQQLASGDAIGGEVRSHAVLLGLQVALTELWRSYGVQPDAVIGHSTGEVAASVVAGALSVADGLRVIVALHRPTIDAVLPGLREALPDLAPQPPTIPVITATGAPSVFDANYWTGDLGNPVRFSQAVTAAGADHGTFVEISPDPVLTGAISEVLGDLHHHSIGTLARGKHDTLTFHTNLNATYTTRPPDAEHPQEPHPVIPTTPWHHTRHWIGSPNDQGGSGSSKPATHRDETGSSAGLPAQHWLTIKQRVESAVSAPRSGTLLGEHIGVATTPPVHLWQAWLKPEEQPYPGLHRVRGVDVVPLSVMLHTLSTAAAECGASALADVRFEDPIVVNEPQVIQVVADDEIVTVASGSAADTPAHEWTRHASARISHELPGAPGAALNGSGLNVAGDPLPVEESFAELQRSWGIDAQPLGWSIGSCRSAPDALQIDVDLPEASTVALLDAAVQVARLTNSSDPRLMMPSVAESVHIGAGLTDSHACIQVSRRSGNADEFTVDIMVTAPDGTTCVDIRALQYVAVESAPAEVAPHDESATPAWSEVPAENLLSELEIRMQAIVARQLGMAASAVGMDRPFPELGLDSMMAMTVLRDAKQLLGIDLSATMLWDHPTISSLAAYLADLLPAQIALEEGSEEDGVDTTCDPRGSLLDELFDSVESAPAGGESGMQ